MEMSTSMTMTMAEALDEYPTTASSTMLSFPSTTSSYSSQFVPSIPATLSSPFLIDTAFILLIQLAFFLLSRRFLTSALPTLRQISSNQTEQISSRSLRSTEADSAGMSVSMDTMNDNMNHGDGNGSVGSSPYLMNASGGTSDREFGCNSGGNGRENDSTSTPSKSRYGKHVPSYTGMEEDDSDDSGTDANLDEQIALVTGGGNINGFQSPSLLNRGKTGNDDDDLDNYHDVYDGDYPLLPLHGTSSGGSGTLGNPSSTSSQSRKSFPRRETDLYPSPSTSKRREPSIRAPSGSRDSNRTTTSHHGKRKVLRIWHGADRGAGGSGSGGGGESMRGMTGKKLGTTRGLGWLARNLFSLCFSESLLLLSLVMFHSVGVFHSRSLHFHFSFSLHVLLMLILFVVPLVQCLQLTYRSRDHSYSSSTTTSSRRLSVWKRLLVSLIPFSLYIFLFTRIPPYVTSVGPVPSSSPLPVVTGFNRTSGLGGTRPKSYKYSGSIHLGDLNDLEEQETLEEDYMTEEESQAQELWQKGGWLEPSLGRLVVCGVVVLGGLSGLGAARTAWMFVENGGGRSGKLVSREDLINAERSLYRIRSDSYSKRLELNAKSNNDGGGEGQGTGAGEENHNWMGKVFGNGFGGNTEVNSLKRELEGLKAVEVQTVKALEAMKVRRQRQRFAKTFRGTLFNIIGYIFAIYCAARVLMCLTSVFFPPLATNTVNKSSVILDINGKPKAKGNTNGDWISFLIALGLSQLPNGVVDVTIWSRAISLLLTGLLILSSLNQVLRNVSRILRLTSKTIGAGFLLLGLAQLMSTYVISLLIQLRSHIPPPQLELEDSDLYGISNSTLSSIMTATSTDDPSLLSTLPDFRTFGRLFDIMFLIAAGGTALFQYIGHKMEAADGFVDVYR